MKAAAVGMRVGFAFAIAFALTSGMIDARADDQAESSEERLPFKSLRLGDSKRTAMTSERLTCAADSTGLFDVACGYASVKDRTYGGVPALEIRFGFFDERLDSVYVELPGGSYERAKRDLDGKFGEVTPMLMNGRPAIYRMNGDRIILIDGPRVAVRYEAAAGTEERERRLSIRRAARRRDI